MERSDIVLEERVRHSESTDPSADDVTIQRTVLVSRRLCPHPSTFFSVRSPLEITTQLIQNNLQPSVMAEPSTGECEPRIPVLQMSCTRLRSCYEIRRYLSLYQCFKTNLVPFTQMKSIMNWLITKYFFLKLDIFSLKFFISRMAMSRAHAVSSSGPRSSSSSPSS
ncbi:hypothetical protein AVEN_258575-1 [Araneus ventricosus]|uniref:Uncharacterized protein n=1 Tax=Araneus ventricosus TaxID=182803 RepID=A0A4Y2RLX5_ARAVE|nr:hypothetical protein AVEN_258575-1 [Araneus ventricosus]